MPFVKLPTWKDELGPAYAFGQGAAAPTMTVLTGSTHIRGLAFSAGDRMDVVVQFNHDVVQPGPGGTITFSPHCHYTFVDNPTAGDAVRWKFTYLGAQPSLTGASAFGTTPTTISSSRHVLSSTEIAKHYLAELPAVPIASTAYAASYILWGTFELSTLSTIAGGKVALLAFDFHKQVYPHGTAGEYV